MLIYESIATELRNAYQKKMVITTKLANDIKQSKDYYSTTQSAIEEQKLQAAADAAIDELISNLKQFVDSKFEAFDKEIESRYFADISASDANNLAVIGQSRLDLSEMAVYVKRYKGNPTVLRFLEKVAADLNFQIFGLTYSRELDILKNIKSFAYECIANLNRANESVAFNIGLQMMEDRITEYKELLAKEPTVSRRETLDGTELPAEN